jgi:hypothetical protein
VHDTAVAAINAASANAPFDASIIGIRSSPV